MLQTEAAGESSSSVSGSSGGSGSSGSSAISGSSSGSTTSQSVGSGGGMTGGASTLLPWGAHKERAQFPATVHIDTDLRPGEFVMRTLFAEFTVMAERKIECVMQEPLVSCLLLVCAHTHVCVTAQEAAEIIKKGKNKKACYSYLVVFT